MRTGHRHLQFYQWKSFIRFCSYCSHYYFFQKEFRREGGRERECLLYDMHWKLPQKSDQLLNVYFFLHISYMENATISYFQFQYFETQCNKFMNENGWEECSGGKF